MEGNILGVDLEKNQVAVKASNGDRYYFVMSEWKGASNPKAGVKVDFDKNAEGVAINVYPMSEPKAIKTEYYTVGSKPEKTRRAAILWALFFGAIGAHKFYVGSWGWGLMYILFCWTYIPLLLCIIETVRYVILTDNEFQQKYELLDGSFDFLW